MKPVLLECSKNIYKFKLPFSVLVKLRDENIDFMSGEAWMKIEKDVQMVYPIIQMGVAYAEGREVENDEVIEIVDDLMESVGFQGVYAHIMDAISIKGAYKMDGESEESEESEDSKKKK